MILLNVSKFCLLSFPVKLIITALFPFEVSFNYEGTNIYKINEYIFLIIKLHELHIQQINFYIHRVIVLKIEVGLTIIHY